MGIKLGIIGGGQLGMMLTEAARNLDNEIADIVVLDPTRNCPAVQAGAIQIVADYKDQNAIRMLAVKTDIITYEIESGDSAVLKKLEGRARINPSPETLRIIQDKLLQKTVLAQADIRVAEFKSVESHEVLKKFIDEFGYPVLLKARRDAYDGRGNYRIDSAEDIQKAYAYFKDQKLMVERFVPFKMEISVIAARSTKGQIATYWPVENIHKENILTTTIAPARIDGDTAEAAVTLAEKTMRILQGAGVFGIEMFVMQNNDILINEIAPRVHNSGHHTLQSSKTSQFEQHLRAIMGMDLGSTELVHPTIMYNILGDADVRGRYQVSDPGMDNAFLKIYNKALAKPKRKMGHINIVAKNGQDIADLLARLEEIKKFQFLRPA